METAKTLYILRCLADGIDPQTGKAYDITHPFQQPDTIRALFTAVQVLEHGTPPSEQSEVKLTFRSSLPPNADKPWDDEEDDRLCRSLAGQVSIPQIATNHGRTHADIRSRLEKMGQREKPDQATALLDNIPQQMPPSASQSQPVALDPPQPRPAASEPEVPAGLYVFRKMALPH